MDKEALMMGKLVSGLVLTSEQDKQWLNARFEMFSDILEESWIYQHILQKGEQRGIERGKQQGREEEKKEEILLFVEVRFPSLLPHAKQLIGRKMSFEQLRTLLRKLYRAKTIEEASTALLDA